MKLNIDFSGIEKSLTSIGGKKASIGAIPKPKGSPPDIPPEEEPEPYVEEIQGLGEINFTAGLITHNNEHVSLHIFHPYEDADSLSMKPADQPKFHVAECRTLDKMRAGGRFARYIAANRTDGLFKVTPYDRETDTRGEEMEANLSPCWNCLDTLDYERFKSASRSEKRRIIREFSLETFFEENKAIFRELPKHTSATMPGGDYTKNFSQITKKFRTRKNWTCECCGVNLANNKGLLHSHHKNGNRGDNILSNLKALCVTCHKAQPFHDHMPVNPSEKRQLTNLRTEQNLPPECGKCRSA